MLAFTLSGRNSMVECQLPKLKVASSILVARSIIPETTYVKKIAGGNIAVAALILACSLKLSERLKKG
jgi:hypothetical protein